MEKISRPFRWFTLFLFAMVSFAMADGEIWKHPVKSADMQSIEKVFAPMTVHPIVRGNFKQTKTIPQLNKAFVSTGKFTIMNNRGVLWNTEKPFPSKMAISDKRMIQETPSGKVEMRTDDNMVFSQTSETIQSVFSGNPAKLAENFNVYFMQEKSMWTIGLIPKEPAIRKVIASIELLGNEWLSTVKLIDGNNGPLLYEFSNLTPAQELLPEENAYLEK